jgi:hypothetical protein
MNTQQLVAGIGTALFALVTLFGGWAYSSLTGDVATLKANETPVRERVTKTETQIEDVDRRLERIEEKLDKVIDHVTDAHDREKEGHRK